MKIRQMPHPPPREKKLSLRKAVRSILQIITHSEGVVAVNYALEQVHLFFGADRVYIGYFDETNSSLSFIHEVASKKQMTLQQYLSNQFTGSTILREEDYPWWVGNIKKGIDSVVSDVDEMPLEAQREKELMKQNGSLSALTTPIFFEGKIRGYISVDFTRKKHAWTATDIKNIQMFADLFSIIIDNEQMEQVVNDSAAEIFKSSAIFKIIFDYLPVGIKLFDEKGIMVDVNPFAINLLGTKKAQLLGLDLFKNPHISEEDLIRIRNGEERTYEADYDFGLINNGGYYTSSHGDKIIRLLGRCVPLKGRFGEIIGYLALLHHETSYYQRKEELRDNLQKLKMAVNNSNSFIWDYDVEKDEIQVQVSMLDPQINQYVIRSVEVNEKRSREDHLGRIHANDVERVRAQFEQLMRGEITSFTDTYRQLFQGKLNWYTTFFRVYKVGRDKKPTKIVCMTRNINQEREKDLELFKEKEKNRVKNAFLENLSHELRTPLNVIVGFANILADTNDTDENRYFVDLIHKNNESLLQIIETLLNFSKVEGRDMIYDVTEVDVKKICLEATVLKFSNQKPHVPLLFDPNLPSLLLQTDRDSITQVLFHLLDNAYKFTEEGAITLHYYACNEKEVRIEVRDTGIGMDGEEIIFLFEQLDKAENFRVGEGIGLSIARKIIEDLGGTTGVESKKGVGSTFWFTQPLADKV